METFVWPSLSVIQMWMTFLVIGVSMICFAIDEIPLEITAIGVVAALLLLFQLLPVSDGAGGNLLDAEHLLAGFANPVLFTIMALLMLGQGLFQTGAVEIPARLIARLGRKAPQLALAATLLIAGAVSAFLNNTPVVVIFIPIVSSIASALGYAQSRVLMPLSFIAILGGATTLIGSSSNLIVSAMARSSGFREIAFFEFTVLGVVMAGIGAAYVIFVLPALMRPRAARTEAGTEAASKPFVAQISLGPDHPWVGARAVAGLFPRLSPVTVRMIHRGRQTLPRPFDDVVLQEGDTVSLVATRATLTGLLARARPRLTVPAGGARASGADDASPEIVPGKTPMSLAEAVVAPGSGIQGLTIDGAAGHVGPDCWLLGIQRRRRMLRVPFGRIRLRPGDVLLFLGTPEAIRSLRRHRDVLLLAQSATQIPRTHHTRSAVLIFALTIAAAVSGLVPIVIAAIGGAIAMIAVGCLTVHQGLRAIDPRIYLMIGAAFGLAEALQATGGAELLARAVVDGFADYGAATLLSALFLLSAILTNFLSNQATAALMTPVTISAALQVGADPAPFVYGLIIALNCSFATPMAYQTNLLVMGPGDYRFRDFLIGGLPLVLIIWVAFSIFAPAYYGL